MQAIITKTLPPTNHLPLRVKATTLAGNITLRYENIASENDNHGAVARALADKLQWKGELVGGTPKRLNSMVWVFVNDSPRA